MLGEMNQDSREQGHGHDHGLQEKMERMEQIREVGSKVAQEKGYISSQLQGLEMAQEKLESLSGDGRTMYEIVGPLIVELKDEEDAEGVVKKDLKELRGRLQELEEREQDMKQMYNDLQQQVQEEMSQQPGMGQQPGLGINPRGM